MRKAALLIAAGLGSGYAPILPGTCGTLACMIFWYLLYAAGIHWPIWLPLIVTALGLLAAHLVLTGLAAAGEPAKDPQYIVIDEWAGVLIALVRVTPQEPLMAVLGFLLFRLFDMTKPGPVRWAERLPGAWGVMADDVLAGVFAALVLEGIRWTMF